MKYIFYSCSFFLLFTINNVYAQFTSASGWTRTAQGTNPDRIWIGDFNGDGLSDKLRYDGRYWKVSLSNGTSFSNEEIWLDQIMDAGSYYTGDFNGDRMDDIAARSDDNHWSVAFSMQDYYAKNCKYYFSRFSDFSGDSLRQLENTGLDINKPLMGDVDGDGNKDQIYISSGTGQWQVTKARLDKSAVPINNEKTNWWNPGAKGILKDFVGDFNGDRLSDAAYLSSDGSLNIGINSSPPPDGKRIVAVWFGDWYEKGKPAYNDTRDSKKIPVAGWGDTTAGLYNSKDHAILEKQIDAMVKAGINLIIVDHTNGWYVKDSFLKGVEFYHEGLKALFDVMLARQKAGKQIIPIAIGLGYEFWGRQTIQGYGRLPQNYKKPEWDWKGIGKWDGQYKRQANALHIIDSLFAGQNSIYRKLYFNYLGKPLVVAYMENGYDYPPREDNGNVRAMWSSPDFTVIPAINWNNTFGWNTNKDSSIFKNGQADKRTWGWGAEWDSTHPNVLCREQPYNAECMSVMPGTYCWNANPHDSIPSRNGGSYYITSWRNILKAKPNITLIGGWNNWNEETAIEGCIGTNGWKDYYGDPQYDWYLQITTAYAELFKENSLSPGTYFKIEGDSNTYHWDGKKLSTISESPHVSPIICIPEGYDFTKRMLTN